MEGYFTLSQQQPEQIFEEDFEKRKRKRRTTFSFQRTRLPNQKFRFLKVGFKGPFK